MNTSVRFSALAVSVFLSIASVAFAQSASATADIEFSLNCNAPEPTECVVLESDNETAVQIEQDVSAGDTFALHIFVDNPEGQGIVSVSSWLKYQPDTLKAMEISDQGSGFPLAAPDGNEIDEASGVVKIGRAVAGGTVSDQKILVATVVFQVVSAISGQTEISFVNFQQEALGNTAVFTLDPQVFQPINILEREPKKLQITFSGGTYSAPPSDTATPHDSSQEPTPPSQPDVDADQLPRPEGVRIQTSLESTDLIWQISDHPDVHGYYVYWSTQSGFYIHRVDTGNTNHAEFSDLEQGTKYYFAVTAYDESGRESDYSDEVFAIHGEPGSESHRFMLQDRDGHSHDQSLQNLTTSDKNLDETGPAETMAIALAILGMCFVFFSFRRFSFDA